MIPLESHVALTALNTFGLPAVAHRFARVDSVATARGLVADGHLACGHTVLGGGSNTIFEGDVAGVLLHVVIRGRRLVSESDDAWVVEAGAGENWHDFVCWTLAQGWPGLENLALIPGTVGAAPIQNIGAYGVEMAARFSALDAVELSSGEVRTFDAADCAFGYRDSCFKGVERGRWLITAVRFSLPRRWAPVLDYADVAGELRARGIQHPEPAEVANAVMAIRRRKLPDPAQVGNAGSFFKNPVLDAGRAARFRRQHPGAPCHDLGDGTSKLAAGWLIDQCGWKGRAIGPVGVYERQALVLVNLGGATGADVRLAAAAIQASVRERFDIALEPEPVFVGADRGARVV